MVQRQALPHDLQMIHQRTGHAQAGRQGLARVDHRPASHRDDDLNLRARPDACLNQGDVGFMRNGEGCDRTARRGQIASQRRAAARIAAMDQQDPPPQGRDPPGGHRRLPPAEQDLGGGGKGKELGHGASCR